MKLHKIIEALQARSDLKAWSVEHVLTKGGQQYELSDTTEAERSVATEHYVLRLLRETPGPDGNPTSGTGSVTILPGGNIDDALSDAALTAGLVHNEPYSFPEPAPVPNVPLSDDQLQANPTKSVEDILKSLKDSAAKYPHVRLTAAECFADEISTRLVNSRGIDATQKTTNFHLEWVFIAGEGDEEVESFVMIDRRRAVDLDLENEVARRAQYTTDLLIAEPPPEYTGPIILRGGTLATFMNSTVIKVLSQGEFKYTAVTPWEVGRSVFRSEVKGDPLNIWANRQLPYGSNSNLFDREGIPSQRVELIQNNKLVTFTASQRFSDYLGIPATGEFGDIEVANGKKPASALMEVPHVEIVEFSWFNPDTITADFACEIRLGYVVEGKKRTPFKGGLLVGNLIDALANMNWSSETDFYGDYLGPTTARCNELTVASGS